MTGNRVLATGVISKLEQAIKSLHEAKKLNDQLQAKFPTGSDTWHMCESIDDKIHDALAALGE